MSARPTWLASRNQFAASERASEWDKKVETETEHRREPRALLSLPMNDQTSPDQRTRRRPAAQLSCERGAHAGGPGQPQATRPASEEEKEKKTEVASSLTCGRRRGRGRTADGGLPPPPLALLRRRASSKRPCWCGVADQVTHDWSGLDCLCLRRTRPGPFLHIYTRAARRACP